MNISIMTSVKVLVLIKWSLRSPPQLRSLLKLGLVIIFWPHQIFFFFYHIFF